MYMDKLDGRINQEFFDRNSANWRREQAGLLSKIQDIQKAAAAPIDQAVDVLQFRPRYRSP
jgi:site-specific DNA recombinase